MEHPPSVGRSPFELENERDEDRLHFWAIHQGKGSKFVGMIGLGDELQLAASAYNLGYWVRSFLRRQNIANRAVDAVFDWVRDKQDQALIEITVHPHNKADCQHVNPYVTGGRDCRLMDTWVLT